MYLVLHSTYNSVEVALFSDGVIIDAICLDKYEASAQMIVALDTLCTRAHRTISQVEYCVVQAGPGPFATLRAVLATANGLAAATGIKLVAVDGLRTLLDEYHDAAYPVTVALLNAYSGDLYYAIADHEQVTTGIFYGVDALQQALGQLPDGVIRFLGNGVPIYEKLLHELYGNRLVIPDPNPETCSLTGVAYVGFQQWNAQQGIVEQILPLYLKRY